MLANTILDFKHVCLKLWACNLCITVQHLKHTAVQTISATCNFSLKQRAESCTICQARLLQVLDSSATMQVLLLFFFNHLLNLTNAEQSIMTSCWNLTTESNWLSAHHSYSVKIQYQQRLKRDNMIVEGEIFNLIVKIV